MFYIYNKTNFYTPKNELKSVSGKITFLIEITHLDAVSKRFETQTETVVTHHNVNKIRINDALTTEENISF